MIKAPKTTKPQHFTEASKAVKAIEDIYYAQVDYLRATFDEFSNGKMAKARTQGYYPYLKIEVTESSFKKLASGSKHSFGFVTKPGVYETTLTRPDFFSHYYHDQIEHLLNNHDVPVEVGVSDTPIPIHFALGEDFHLENSLSELSVRAKVRARRLRCLRRPERI